MLLSTVCIRLLCMFYLIFPELYSLASFEYI